MHPKTIKDLVFERYYEAGKRAKSRMQWCARHFGNTDRAAKIAERVAIMHLKKLKKWLK